MNNNISHPIKGWKILKQLHNKNQAHPPYKLRHNNNIVSSPKALTDIMNNHYISKINKIRSNSTNHKIEPIDMLKKLHPRVKSKLKIPPLLYIKQIL